ncbi:hypothetical protein [Streptomyces sp. NPDC018045]|uniref:hypothetical protein n=1 Tax=Streptomyces sp. NPDC018045 TaxID=3365037 RepID=UPI0037BB10CA
MRKGPTGAAALLGVAAPMVAAVPAGAASAGAPPGPGEVVPGQRTATPALVEGVREPAAATGSPADAARGHLAAKEARYHIGDPGRDLRPVQTVDAGGHETVRLQQRHRGVDVLGGQYVVRMEHQGGERVVTGAFGKYFTGLKTGVDPEAAPALAVERAVDRERRGHRPAPGRAVAPARRAAADRHRPRAGRHPARRGRPHPAGDRAGRPPGHRHAGAARGLRRRAGRVPGAPVQRDQDVPYAADRHGGRRAGGGTCPDALRASELAATDEAVTVAASTPDTVYRNETLSKLWQFSPDGSRRSRVSCNRGEQAWPAMPGGRQVVWLDGTTGYTDLVTRNRPAGRCD